MTFKKIFKVFLIVVPGFFVAPIHGQNVKDSAKNQLNVSLNYQSALHYFGRVDSLNSSGLFPLISLKSKTGLYLNSSFIFIKNSSATFNYTGTILEAGYKFPYSKNFSGNIYYDHFLYKDKTLLQQAALKGQAGINTAYNNKVVNVNLGGDIKFSNKETDLGITGGLDKLLIFRNILPKAALALDPSAYVYTGTHNYIVNAKNSGPLGLPSNTSSLQQAKEFTILSYEISLPIIFVRGKFNAYISPAYVIPQNLVTVTGRPDLSERGSNLFYFAAGIGARF